MPPLRVSGAAPGRRGAAQTLRSQRTAAGTRRALRVKGVRQREHAALQGRLQEEQVSSAKLPKHGMPILPDLQLPKQSTADIGNTKSKSTKCIRRADGSPCIL